VPGIVALGHSKILANYVAGRGRPDINAVRGVMALAINVVANLFLIPRYGIIGAAAATSISYSVSAFAGYLAFLRIAGVKWSDPLVPPFRELVGLIRKLLRKSNSSIPSGS
jgi:O-antigen/teichoic acid export membrane protein